MVPSPQWRHERRRVVFKQFNKKLRPRVIYSMGVHDVGHYFMVRLHFGATEGGAAAQCNEVRHRAGHPITAHYTVSDCDMDTF